MTERPFRVLPRVDDRTRPFWTGGAEGKLRFLRCGACGWWQHPPGPVCALCLSDDLAADAVSGRATVHTYTVNHQPWYPGLDPPYVIAIVELPEQVGLRLTTNIVRCEPDEVHIGMEVQVTFADYDDVWLPLFTPTTGGGDD